MDALGYLVRFVILPGQAHDLIGVAELLEDLRFGALIGDRALDVEWFLEEVKGSGATAAIHLVVGAIAATSLSTGPSYSNHGDSLHWAIKRFRKERGSERLNRVRLVISTRPIELDEQICSVCFPFQRNRMKNPLQ